MEKGLVSIIMLSRNKEKFVADSVRSVICQTYQNWELLFVDDNSEDGTIKLMMDLMREDTNYQREHGVELAAYPRLSSRVKVPHTTNTRGTAITRNNALKEAIGKWVFLMPVIYGNQQS